MGYLSESTAYESEHLGFKVPTYAPCDGLRVRTDKFIV
jgi:hypothetical protein